MTDRAFDCDSAVELHRINTAALVAAFDMPEDLASIMAFKLTEAQRQVAPASELYVPAPDKARRNAAIRSMFNGQNLDEVCRAFSVSKTTVYRACSRRG